MLFLARRNLIGFSMLMFILTLIAFVNYRLVSLLADLYGKNRMGRNYLLKEALSASHQESLLLTHRARSLRNLDLLFNKTINDDVFFKEQRQGPPLTDMRNSSNTETGFILPPTCPTSLFLLILLPVRRKSFAARQAIRKSWGNSDNQINQLYLRSVDSYRYRAFTWKTIFVVGRSRGTEGSNLEEESRLHKDILKVDTPEGYRNIQKKVMLSLSWASLWCKCSFVLKTDEDAFVNIHRVLPWVEHLVEKNILYAGAVNYDAPVIRDWEHPNFVSFEDHPQPTYKPYCSGGGYFLAGSFLKNLTQAAKSIPPIANEDAYIGMVTDSLGVKPYDERRILPYFELSLNGFVSSHGVCDWIDQLVIHRVRGKYHVIMHWNAVTALSTRTLCMFKNEKLNLKPNVAAFGSERFAGGQPPVDIVHFFNE